MSKYLSGVAALALLGAATFAMPATAAERQAGVTHPAVDRVQLAASLSRRPRVCASLAWRPALLGGTAPLLWVRGPYAYYDDYPYGYYRPGPFVSFGVGPFGFWF